MGDILSSQKDDDDEKEDPCPTTTCPPCPPPSENYTEILIYYVSESMNDLPAQTVASAKENIKEMSTFSQKKLLLDIIDDYIGRVETVKAVSADQKTRDLYAMNLLAHR